MVIKAHGFPDVPGALCFGLACLGVGLRDIDRFSVEDSGESYFGFVTDIDVALRKYSIDNVEIQPINSTTKMVKKPETKIIQDGSELNLALLWHCYPEDPRKYEFMLADEADNVIADNFNTKIGFFYVKAAVYSKTKQKVLFKTFYARFDPSDRLQSRVPIAYGSYKDETSSDRRNSCAVRDCAAAYYNYLSKGDILNEK